MTKQQFKTKKEIVNIYRARQMDTFERLETYPNQWDMMKIKSILANGNIEYEELPDYKRIYPFLDLYLQEKNLKESDLTDIELSNIKFGSCQLCGHWIKDHFYIKCPDKKLIMHVGSTCINEFKGAEYVYRTIKQFESSQLQLMFTKWIDYAIDICNSKKVNGSYYYIEPEYYDFRKKLLKIKSEGIELLSDTKIKNIFKKATELNIPIDDQQINIQKENKAKELENKKQELINTIKGVRKLGYDVFINKNITKMVFLEQNNEPVEFLNYGDKIKLEQFGVKYSDKYEQFVIYTNIEQ